MNVIQENSYNKIVLDVNATAPQKQMNSEKAELKELKMYSETSDTNIKVTWQILKLMQEELGLPRNMSVKDLNVLYLRLEEVKKVLDLQVMNFSQLNQLNFEILKLQEIMDFSDETPMSTIIADLSEEKLVNLGRDSLLGKIILFNQLKLKTDESL
ncbi:MAG: hypothetical protein ACW99R_02660 [Candidatus Hodarchaeales archaeon]